MIVERYIPRTTEDFKHGAERGDDAWTEVTIRAEFGEVEVFTFPGNERHRAFTSLKMWLHPHMYHRTLKRHYQDCWLRRLANDFAASCAAAHEGRIRG